METKNIFQYTISTQPNEILIHILKYVPNLDLTISRRVCKKWRYLIETKVLFKQITPSIEECFILPDYFHFRKYLNMSLQHHQKSLLWFTQNKIFMKCHFVT